MQALWTPPGSATAEKQNKQIKAGKRPRKFDENPARGRQKDCEARWVKKNDEPHYGWKNHIKADAKTKLIEKQVTTDASVHDSQAFKELVDGSDEAVLAYSEEEKKRNRLISKVRVRVEHIFGRMSQMGAEYCRSMGLWRARQHNSLRNLVYNMDRYAFLMR